MKNSLFTKTILAFITVTFLAACDDNEPIPEPEKEAAGFLCFESDGNQFVLEDSVNLRYEEYDYDGERMIQFAVQYAGNIIEIGDWRVHGFTFGMDLTGLESIVREYEIVDPTPYFNRSPEEAPPVGQAWVSLGEIERLDGTTNTQVFLESFSGSLRITEVHEDRFSGIFTVKFKGVVDGEDMEVDFIKGVITDFPRIPED